MGIVESEHHRMYAEAGEAYIDYIGPGKTVISIGPYYIGSDPTLLQAASLQPDRLYVADPRSKSHPIHEEDVWNIVGPIDAETGGNIDEYLDQLHILEDQFVMNLKQPIWLGPYQGLLHLELPSGELADVITDRGTSGFVIAEDDRYADIREALLLRAFQADRSVLRDGGVLLLQTNHIAHGYRRYPWEIWNISIPTLLKEAGFRSVSYHKVTDTHKIPISARTAERILEEAEKEYMLQDLGLFDRLAGAIVFNQQSAYLEFSKKTQVGVHTKLYNDMYIATA